MKHRIVIIIILSSFLTATGQNTNDKVKTNDALIMDLEKSIPMMMDDVQIPGLSIALINKSGIIWQGNFGVESQKTNAPIDDSTIFVAASFSKVVFGYLILKMVDEDKIDLDKPLIQYAPKTFIEKEFKKINDESFYEITSRMVLTHSTGFPDMIMGRSVKINFEPGSDFSYSGEAFYLLQKVVENIEGKPINEIMKEKVFTQLGMHNTSYVYEEMFKNRMAKGHGHKLSNLINRKMLGNRKPHTARSLLTTTHDFAKFLIAFSNGKGLTNNIFNEALSPQINANAQHIFWGLGIGIETFNGDTVYWHDGEAVIFENYFAFNKRQDIGFVYFSNSANGLSIGEQILEKIIPAKHPSFQWIGIDQYYSTTKQLSITYNNSGIEETIELYYKIKDRYPWKDENVLNDFGYYLLGNKKIVDAIQIFELNVKEYPNSSNVYDSLGEAYMKNKDRALSIKNYEKSLEINPDNSNAIEKLKKLKQ